MSDLDQLLAYVQDHRQVLLVGVMAVVLLVIVGTLIWSARRGRPDRWVANIVGLVVLALSAEGMWVVARERLHLPALFAGTVFFVGEAYMVAAMMRGNRHHAKHGHPGKHAATVWIAAAVMGGIVSLNSASIVEFPLRVALPLAAAKLWHDTVTDDDVEREQSSWKWTPRRLFIALGAIEAGDRDILEINRQRLIDKMTRAAFDLPKPRAQRRLTRLALDADDDIVEEVRRRVTRVTNIAKLTRPGDNLAPSDASAVAPTGTPVARQPGVSGHVTRDATRTTTRPTRRLTGSAATIAKVRAKKPELTKDEVAAKTGVGLRTVQRHWDATAPAVPAQPERINGHEFAEAQ